MCVRSGDGTEEEEGGNHHCLSNIPMGGNQLRKSLVTFKKIVPFTKCGHFGTANRSDIRPDSFEVAVTGLVRKVNDGF
jgi:hypothetical protein